VRDGARPGGGGQKRDGARDGGRGGDRGRDGGRGDGRRREESRTPMQVHSSAPTKRGKDAVLDSPFAKLMALREALEKKT
jgi:ATP-dependent RNA helicase SUPV3L1/SUV3